jgi:hypothetical protein
MRLQYFFVIGEEFGDIHKKTCEITADDSGARWIFIGKARGYANSALPTVQILRAWFRRSSSREYPNLEGTNTTIAN